MIEVLDYNYDYEDIIINMFNYLFSWEVSTCAGEFLYFAFQRKKVLLRA